MDVAFLGQPFVDHGGSIADDLAIRLETGEFSSVRIASAWAKRSGVSRFAPPLTRFRAQGGRAQLIVGIDQGGATRQGLEAALDAFDEVFIFHDPGSRTFHPKVYLLEGADWSHLVVGSNNLTAGGLYHNYEAAMVLHLEHRLEQDAAIRAEVHAWFETLTSDTEVCLPLDNDLLAALMGSAVYLIADEDAERIGRPSLEEDFDGVTRVEDDRLERLFGRSRKSKKSFAPRIPLPLKASSGQAVQGSGDVSVDRQYFGRDVEYEWSKRLSASDAQRPPSVQSNPTGVLRLTQANHDIDQTRFFRWDMFGDLQWAVERRGANEFEVVDVPFNVSTPNGDAGLVSIRISHASHREAHQSNVTTVLHWGALSRILEESDYTGGLVVLRKHSDASYYLELHFPEE